MNAEQTVEHQSVCVQCYFVASAWLTATLMMARALHAAEHTRVHDPAAHSNQYVRMCAGMKQRLQKRMGKTESELSLTRDSELLRNVMETRGGSIEALVRKVKERYDRCAAASLLSTHAPVAPCNDDTRLCMLASWQNGVVLDVCITAEVCGVALYVQCERACATRGMWRQPGNTTFGL